MQQFNLTPESIPILAKFLVAFVVTAYVIVSVKNTKSVLWFTWYLIGYTTLDFFAFTAETFQTDWATLSLPLEYLASIGFTFCYLQFAYCFKDEFFKKEQRIVTFVTGFFAILGVLFTIYQFITIGFGDYAIIQSLLPFPLLMISWSGVVFYRKYRLERKRSSGTAVNRAAYKSFFLITILAIIISITPVLRVLSLINIRIFTLFFFVLNLIVFCLLTATMINYLADRTTVLVKLVGISLVLFVTVIGLQGFLVIPEYERPNPDTITVSERQEIHAQLVPYASFLFGSSSIILLLFPIFYNKSVLKPLRTLLSGVNQVSKGNLDTTIPVINQDEFGIVTVHFNKMIGNLNNAQKALKEYAEKLEERVEERTKELNLKNTLLEQQTQELERMNGFRTKLFMDISHELRTPITLVSGPLQSLLEKDNIDSDTEYQLQVALRNSDRLKQLVEQIISINRLEAGQLVLHISKIDITKKVSYFISSFQSLLDYKNISLKYTIPDDPIKLYVDEDKLETIINNLISNSLKFTPENGEVSISLTELKEGIEITISDTGIGIAPDKLPTIFERYQTSASNDSDYREGLGVGLAITKEYIQLHRGTISVKSTPGEGTTFTVYLKKGMAHFSKESINCSSNNTISNQDKALSKPITFKNKPAKKLFKQNGPLILVVEDNQDMANYIQDILINEGYKVAHAKHGKAALTLLDSLRPDLIISDIMMPVMNGMEFLKNLRAIDSYSSTPTIFLSARSDIEGRIESFRLGVNDYLIKPFNIQELTCRIENLLEFSEIRNQFALELSEEDQSTSLDQQFITKLTKLTEERMADPSFNIEELARKVAMSRRTFYREIKKKTGFSAGAFVKEIRLQKARQKLEAGLVQNIDEISIEVGFRTSSYFSKVYYKRFGKNLSEYFN